MHKLRVKVRPLNLGIQDAHIRRRFPGFIKTPRGGFGVWSGPIQPQPVSPVYMVQIVYHLKKHPRVYVIKPQLVRGAPHLYKDRSLCLYWPPEWDWSPDCLIANTIIPWTASWLLFYELWLDTGKWLGPSSHQKPGLPT